MHGVHTHRKKRRERQIRSDYKRAKNPEMQVIPVRCYMLLLVSFILLDSYSFAVWTYKGNGNSLLSSAFLERGDSE